MVSPQAVPAHLVVPVQQGGTQPLSTSNIFSALTILCAMVVVGGLGFLVLYGWPTGLPYVVLGSIDLGVVASARRGARQVRGAAYRHPEGQVTQQIQTVLRERGIAFRLGKIRRWPLGVYRNIHIPSLRLRVGVLQGPQRHSVVLFKGVETSNEESTQLLIMALDKGLFRRSEFPQAGAWI